MQHNVQGNELLNDSDTEYPEDFSTLNVGTSFSIFFESSGSIIETLWFAIKGHQIGFQCCYAAQMTTDYGSNGLFQRLN